MVFAAALKRFHSASDGSQWPRKVVWGLFILIELGLGFFSLSFAQEAARSGPGDWEITPRISVGASYTDNIELAPANQAESDVVFDVEPGISVRKQGGRLDLHLDYAAQGLFYTDNSDADKVNHQLQTLGTIEILKNNFFVDAYGWISQVPVDSRGRTDVGYSGVAGDMPSGLSFLSHFDLGLPDAGNLFRPGDLFKDIALTDNQTTGYRFGTSPYWRQKIGDWAEGIIRYRYDSVFYDEETGHYDAQQAAERTLNADSQTNTITFDLSSGSQFRVSKWNLHYFRQRQQWDDSEISDGVLLSEDDHQEKLMGDVSYRLNKQWSLWAMGGYENNEVADFNQTRDGTYWGLGAIWSPNRYLELGGLYGPDVNLAVLNWQPSARTRLEVKRRDQAVGVDPGVRWEGVFKHRTRFTTWSMTYSDEITNEQQLLGSSLLAVDANGQPLFLGEQGQVATSSPLGLSGRNFRRKRFNASVDYQRGRTGLSFNAFNEDRETQDAVSSETIYGAGALWTWRFAPRIASFLGTGWEHEDLGHTEAGKAEQNNYWVSVIGIAKMFGRDFGGLISYRHYQNDSNRAEEEFRENRLNVRFNMKF